MLPQIHNFVGLLYMYTYFKDGEIMCPVVTVSAQQMWASPTLIMKNKLSLAWLSIFWVALLATGCDRQISHDFHYH